jgi:hypothetical protein
LLRKLGCFRDRRHGYGVLRVDSAPMPLVLSESIFEKHCGSFLHTFTNVRTHRRHGDCFSSKTESQQAMSSAWLKLKSPNIEHMGSLLLFRQLQKLTQLHTMCSVGVGLKTSCFKGMECLIAHLKKPRRQVFPLMSRDFELVFQNLDDILKVSFEELHELKMDQQCAHVGFGSRERY